MNIHELTRSARPLPPATEATLGRARERALVAFRNRPTADTGPAPLFPPVLRWLAAASLAAAVAAVLILRPQPDDSAKLMAELESVFTGRMAGILTRDGEVEVLLSDSDFPRPTDQRVAFKIRGPDGEIIVLTYSGNPVTVGPGHILTPLLSGGGEVLVVGDDGSVTQGWRVRG
jgi:hypothetical protein